MQTKRRYKKIVKQKVKTNAEKDTNDSSCTGGESEDGQSDEETDTTEIEEEDWVDCIKEAPTKQWKRWEM